MVFTAVRREAIPERWFIVSEIPRTARGKVSRDAVRRMLVKEPVADARNCDLATPAPGGEDPAIDAAAPTVRTAVELAWTEVLGRGSYIAGVPLNQTGGDSLDAMRMWLLIEKTLGTRLFMDVLESDPTPSQLTAVLEQQLRVTPVSPSQLVFLMIPAEGDSPSLAHFRALLKDRIHFVMIEYPGWREMIDAGPGFEAIVDAAVAQICRQSGEDVPCLLAGYSFGGLVAVETAGRLVERGRRIGFLGLIDTRAERPPEETRQARSVSRPMKFIGKIFSALILTSAFRPLKIMGQLATLLPAKQAFTIEFMLNTRLRTRSLRRFRLEPMQVPITL